MTPDRIPADDLARRLAALEGDGLDGVAPTAEELAAEKLTAHALGELPPTEAAEVERRLAEEDAEAARRDFGETRLLADRLRAAARPTPGPGPAGSPALRTAVTAALATRDLPAPAPAPRTRPAGRARSLVALLGTAGLAASALVALTVSRDGLEEQARVRRAEEFAGRSAYDAAPEAVASAAAAPQRAEPPATQMAPVAPAPGSAPAAVDSLALDLTPGPGGGEAAGKREEMAAGKRLARQAEVAASNVDGEAEAKLAEDVSGRARPRQGQPAVPAPARGGLAMPAAKPQAIGGQGGASAPQPFFGVPAPQASSQKGRRSIRLGDHEQLAESEQDADFERVAGGGGRQRWFNDRDRLAFTPGAPGTERYARFVENSFRNPAEEGQALSTFSIDVDTASYALVRRFLNDRQVPPPEAVRLEEMLNYFRYDDPAPNGDDPLAVRLESASCPWQPGHRLLRVALKGRDIAAAARPGTSLVFLVDVSGSMNEPNKLPLVKQSLSMLVERLTENDKVAIVTYAGDAGVKLLPTSGDQKDRIRAAIDALSAGGSTNGSAGIEVAYRLAQEAFVKGGSNRVLLATDGDLNVGVTDDAALVGLIKEKAGSGVFLTVLGFGQGNLQDEKMEKLADNGNGIYAYVDGAREARKVLVEQLTGSTVTIAKDVKIQIEFNPAHVAAYRLLGYENRLLAARDFKDDTKDAGEVGAGHGVTALYEIVPAAAAGAGGDVDPLKYQPKAAVKPAPAPEAQPASPELCTVKLRWKAPEASESVARELPFEDTGADFESASADLRFAAAVAEFGMLLRESRHRGRASLEHVASTASGALGTDPGGLRAEFLDLVREAGALLPYERRGTPN